MAPAVRVSLGATRVRADLGVRGAVAGRRAVARVPPGADPARLSLVTPARPKEELY